MNFFEKIWESRLLELDNIKRYNNKYNYSIESVSQHSYWVTMFCDLIAKEIFIEDNFLIPIDIRKKRTFLGMLLSKALWHDVGEIFTGDVLHPVKYLYGERSEVIKENLESLEKEGEENLMFVLFGENYLRFNEEKEQDYFGDTPEFYPLVKRIIKIADWLSVAFKARKEVVEFSNATFVEIKKYSEEETEKAITDLCKFGDNRKLNEFDFINWKKIESLYFGFFYLDKKVLKK